MLAENFKSKLRFGFCVETTEGYFRYKFTNRRGTTHFLDFESHEAASDYYRKARIREQSFSNAKEIFKTWPRLEMFYVISDGNPYLKLAEAEARAAEVKDDWILTIHKDQI
jgi:predicted nucleic acid-binding protein